MQPLKWEFRSNIWYHMWKKNFISKRIHLNIQSGRSRQPDLRLTDLIWSRTESQKCSTFEACSWPCQKWGGRLNEIFPRAQWSNALGGWQDKTREAGVSGATFFSSGWDTMRFMKIISMYGSKSSFNSGTCLDHLVLFFQRMHF